MRSPLMAAVGAAIACAVSTAALAQDGTVNLPTLMNTAYPTQGPVTKTVCTSGCQYNSLQTAINDALPGETVSVAPTFVSGPITLPAKTDNGQWVVIRSSSSLFDATGAVPPGTRVDGRNTTHTSQMPKIEGNSTSAPVVRTLSGANHYRLVGLNIGNVAGVNHTSNLVVVGSDVTTTPAAWDIVFDRVWVHGEANTAAFHHRGIAMNGRRVAVIDSYLSDLKHNVQDSMALGAWNGPGPFKIVNNRLEGGHMAIMFGGSDAKASSMSPADIEVRGNLMTRPIAAWRAAGIQVKNLFELKDARRVLLEGNIMENNWCCYGGQIGMAIVLSVRNQGGSCTWCTIEDVTIRNNLIRNSTGAVDFLGKDDDGDVSIPMRDVLIQNNLFDNIDGNEFGSTSGRTIEMTWGPKWVTFQRNTFINVTTGGITISLDGPLNADNFVFGNNLLRKQAYGIKGSGLADGNATLNAWAAGAVFVDNGFGGASAGTYPPNNYYPSQTVWTEQFMNYNGGLGGGDYNLKNPNVYDNRTDIGANIAAIESATACADDGACGGGSGPTTLFEDDFTATGTPDPAKWTVGVVSGATQDPNIQVTQSGGQLRIGPLPNASSLHYNGVYTDPLDLSNAYAYVQIAGIVTGVEAYTFFTVGLNASNYYRLTVNNGTLRCDKEIGGTKTTLASVTYNPTQHAFVRIRHAGGNMVCETAPASGSNPGTWVAIPNGSEPWSGSVPVASAWVELKAGTSAATANAGTAVFDNVKVIRP